MGNVRSNELHCQNPPGQIIITNEVEERIDRNRIEDKLETEQKSPDLPIEPETYNCYVASDKKKEIVEGLLPHGYSNCEV